MLRTRVIPSLLLKDGGLVKTQKFQKPKYVGDPINAVRIFNEKEVDELVFLDIEASKKGVAPNYELLEQIATEAFMPFGYGGGVKDIEQIKRLYGIGVEKVIINSAAHRDLNLISTAASVAGSQSVVASIDYKKNWRGKNYVYVLSGSQNTKMDPVTYARQMAEAGAGEIILNSIERDGMMSGYDCAILREVAEAVDIPVVALGGAGNQEHLRQAADAGASAAAAGSMFVFHGKHKAVLITYPEYEELERLFT